MPEVSRFYGIIIKMYYNQTEHNPPHIHAEYGEFRSIIDIINIKEIEGNLPKIAKRLVIEWTRMNKNILLQMWQKQRFKKIEPLQ